MQLAKFLFLITVCHLVTACATINRRSERPNSIRFAPRPLRVIQDPTPYYPDASKRAKETGEVILHFHIGAGGLVQGPFDVDIAHSIAAPRLIFAAKQLFQGSRYEVGEQYRHDVTASVLFELMPCGKIKQASGFDYYYHLCNPPIQYAPETIYE